MRGMSGFFDMDGDDMSTQSMPGGMPGSHSQRQNSRRTSSPARSGPSEITRPLNLSLEELYSGTTKHLKIGRRLLNGATEEKVLEIEVFPGWKSGTKIRFPRAGNEQQGGEQDLVFIVEEKPHSVFKREGNDLVCHVRLPLVEALTGSGGKKTVETLDGRKLQVRIPSGVVKPGQETKIPGEGMPVRKDGSVKQKGDLTVKWDVVFPDHLTSSQKEGIRKSLG